MERGICKACQRFFIKIEKYQELCLICYEKDIEDYGVVKEYLFKNSRATMMEVYFDTNISMRTLKRYIAEGRIDIIEK
ncbi:hypothetical protein R9X47_12695 [Wukongibacter baidiensis]|uniref:hypothetical protein n=1 Tax=Wukongibacter baidiensis TaxID=1723361 RepID=UPI003D7F2BDC